MAAPVITVEEAFKLGTEALSNGADPEAYLELLELPSDLALEFIAAVEGEVVTAINRVGAGEADPVAAIRTAMLSAFLAGIEYQRAR